MTQALLFFSLPCMACTFGLAAAAELIDDARFEKEVLVAACSDPMQIEVAADGSVYFVERQGALKRYDATSRQTQTLGVIPVAIFGEVGLLGLALDPLFSENAWTYVTACPAGKRDVVRLSRFTLRRQANGETLDLASERVLLEYQIDVGGAIHMGGGLAFGPDGLLYWGTGDNCPPIPELPVDQRRGHEIADALRTSANSKDLRGKVLRLRPEPDGTYSIPVGNLFPRGADGRPEIFAMGCRNPFHVAIDAKTGWLYWGDVGPNVQPDLGIGPNGYDEFNQARAAGNFGWPMFVGPNEAYAHFDFTTRKPGVLFDASAPVNDSRNNTGIKSLPLPQPAWIWYPTGNSREFPELSNGARSAIMGPIYHFEPALVSTLKLPAALDGKVFIADWTRNWIKTVTLDQAGKPASLDPFLPQQIFRKPIDLKLGPEGALYIAEYGDKWNGNTDAQIVRIVYRRGNRAPSARLEASPAAGKAPLTVHLTAAGSTDRDGDALTFTWNPADGATAALDNKAASVQHTYTVPGVYTARVSVRDTHGAESTISTEIRVGNAPPMVSMVYPPHGSFFDWDQVIRFEATADDEEDGNTQTGTIPADRLVVRTAYRERLRQTQVDALGRPLAADDALFDPGLALMRRGTCFSCHTANDKSAGPPYALVAAANRGKPQAREALARKVLTGGGGVWGSQPMPPHPQHTLEEAQLMVDWVLALGQNPATELMTGTQGGFRTIKKPDHRADAGVYVLTASYSDRGTGSAPPLTGEAVHVLHSRRKRAAFFDDRQGVEIVDEYEGEGTIVTRFAPGDWIRFEDLRLDMVTRIVCRAAAYAPGARGFELRVDAPDGPLVTRLDVPAIVGEAPWREVSATINPPTGVRSYFFVAIAAPDPKRILGLNWIDFEGAPRLEAPAAPPPTAARSQPAPSKPRAFVKEWTYDDLAPRLGELDQGRSLARGRDLFRLMSCLACHRAGGAGGDLGPNLADYARDLVRGQRSRQDLLRDVLEPSLRQHERYRTQVIVSRAGEVLSGLVLAEDGKTIRLAWNAVDPGQVRDIALVDIAERRLSPTSLMPAGLMSTLSAAEVLDLLAFVEQAGAPRLDDKLRAWIESMRLRHGYTDDEIAQALGVDTSRARQLIADSGLPALESVEPSRQPNPRSPDGKIVVTPYPGGRHPRSGFLDGAIDPWRETKVSIFLPWPNAGYVVLDLPEALWCARELVFLAHTHIPTRWDRENAVLPRQDWKQLPGGALANQFDLPNGVSIKARIAPGVNDVDLELELNNGSQEKLTGLRSQVCLMLKSAAEFNDQTNDNKDLLGRRVATRSRDGKRTIVTTWERARPWANPPCPCMHADPVFPDLDPGQSATLRGKITFLEGPEVELLGVRRIWDAAPHNAFTDLVRHRDEWLCTFREGQGHVSPDGAIRVIASSDGEQWQSVARITSSEGDLRDPKLTIAPDGELLLTTAVALADTSRQRHQSLLWRSKDGRSWGDPIRVGDPDLWLWRVQHHAGIGYGIAYATDGRKLIRLYRSADNVGFDKVADNIFDQGEPNESSLVFLEDGTAHCLLRRDDPGGHGQIGTAPPPYTTWTWKSLERRIGGPHLLELADGRLVAAVRLYDGQVRTALVWVDPATGACREFLALPSGGDTSYAGLTVHQDVLWVSYYSSHEGKTSIYLARVKIR